MQIKSNHYHRIKSPPVFMPFLPELYRKGLRPKMIYAIIKKNGLQLLAELQSRQLGYRAALSSLQYDYSIALDLVSTERSCFLMEKKYVVGLEHDLIGILYRRADGLYDFSLSDAEKLTLYDALDLVIRFNNEVAYSQFESYFLKEILPGEENDNA